MERVGRRILEQRLECGLQVVRAREERDIGPEKLHFFVGVLPGVQRNRPLDRVIRAFHLQLKNGQRGLDPMKGGIAPLGLGQPPMRQIVCAEIDKRDPEVVVVVRLLSPRARSRGGPIE